MQNNDRKPKIRFSGFDAGWKKKRFGDEFDILSNNTFSRDLLNYDQGIAKNVHYGDVLVKFNEYLDASKEILPFIEDREAIDKFRNSFLKDGDIVIADTAEDETVGKCTEIGQIGDLPIIAGLHTMPCRPKVKYAPMYLGYYLNANVYHRELLPLMQGVKVTSISRSGVKDTDIIVSEEYDEQENIGQFLFTLDEKIKFEQDKWERLIILKKSMLKKMFPQGDSKVPEIRFGKYTDEWEQRKLTDFGKSTSGTSIESEFSENGIYKVISIGSYSENSVYTDQGIRAVDSEKTRKRILNKDNLTMILNDKTASGNIIGRVLLIEKSGVYVYNQRTERIEIDSENYDSVFIYQMLNAPEIREKIIKQSQGNTQIYVNWSKISLTEYMVPKIEEQRKIGIYFQNLDNLITIHQRKVDKLKNIKSSCMDKMFV